MQIGGLQITLRVLKLAKHRVKLIRWGNRPCSDGFPIELWLPRAQGTSWLLTGMINPGEMVAHHAKMMVTVVVL